MIDTRSRLLSLFTRFGTDPSKLTDATTFTADLQYDSLDVVEVVMAAESEFGIEIEDGMAERLKTVGDVVALVEHKLAEKAKAA